jgi:hypothetical protein
MSKGRFTASAQTRRSAIAHNLAGVFVVACWLRLNATRAQLSAHRSTGTVSFTPWPAVADPARPTFHKGSARAYARKRMLACLAGPAAESLRTNCPAPTADRSEALALSYAVRIGARDKAHRWLKDAQQAARRIVHSPNILPAVEAVAAELLKAGAVSKADVYRIVRRVVPHPPFWNLPVVEGGAR